MFKITLNNDRTKIRIVEKTEESADESTENILPLDGIGQVSIERDEDGATVTINPPCGQDLDDLSMTHEELHQLLLCLGW